MRKIFMIFVLAILATACGASYSPPDPPQGVELVQEITGGSNPLRLPLDVAVDRARNIYVVDGGNNRI
jgi:hypothetical protein